MKSWTNWVELTKQNIKNVPKNTKGVYVIRRTKNVKAGDSDIIYIGNAGTGKRGVRERLSGLILGLKTKDDKKAKNLYHAIKRIRGHINEGLEFSWIECFQAPDGVEKAFLLAFWISSGKLSVC